MPLRPPRVVFVTGATGFIGRSVLDALASAHVAEIRCLVRTKHSAQREPVRTTFIRGDLDEPESYAASLVGADSVVHLAAAIGNASDAELERVNVIGTQKLVAAAKSAGVRQFIFMSSIAAKASDVSHYPYARTKLAAERLVASSGLGYAILRPTIVLGTGGGNWPMLRKLANLPAIPMFGGGRARVQPVDVADVARAVALTLEGRAGTEPISEIGGPETLTFAELILAIRRACGRSPAPLLYVPYGPARTALAVLERLSAGKLPVRAGQLTPFVADGVADSCTLLAALQPAMSPLRTLLERLAHA